MLGAGSFLFLPRSAFARSGAEDKVGPCGGIGSSLASESSALAVYGGLSR